MTEHTSKRYNDELEDIRSKLLRMGGIVESLVRDAIDAVETGNSETINRIFDNEKITNTLEIEIDKLIAETIALNQPAAVDLRFLVSVLKMITDMERSGDEAEKVAKMARSIHEGDIHYDPLIEIRHIGNLVVQMLNKLLDAFARDDAILAAEIVRADKKVDKEWKSLLRLLSSYMVEDPRRTSEIIDLIFIVRSFERVGDHAKNMAERIIYYVQGEDVRHAGAKHAERVARGEV